MVKIELLKGRNLIQIFDDYAKILITSKKHGNFKIVIDLEDVERVETKRWCVSKYWNKKTGYRPRFYCTSTDRVLLHRFLVDAPKGMQVDHIDGNEFNNRKDNLRVCSRNENYMNKRKYTNNTSGATGVYWSKKDNKWMAGIFLDNKFINLGYFIDFKEAVKVRREAELKYFGEFSPSLGSQQNV